MKSYTIFAREMDCKDPHRNAVVDSLQLRNTERLRVYRTSVTGLDKPVILSTTSKEAHLYFGLFDPEKDELYHFGQLINGMFKHDHEDGYSTREDVFRDPEFKNGHRTGWQVTRTETGEMITFEFSPAN